MTTKRMLVDASHPEETRIVITDGNRLDEFDFEAANRRQLRGNIYLAKVTRVEPSLQAAFVEYGGNRHGFLAFSEIHPDYFQIPKADREALLRAEAEIVSAQAKLDAQMETDNDSASIKDISGHSDGTEDTTKEASPERLEQPDNALDEHLNSDEKPAEETTQATGTNTLSDDNNPDEARTDNTGNNDESSLIALPSQGETQEENTNDASDGNIEADQNSDLPETIDPQDVIDVSDELVEDLDPGLDELLELRRAQARRYKIQEVIKRRQVLLIQVVKEERGNKGAALTTYLSLAGRYSVLMPNTARGGGISRKITSGADRKRLKKIASELSVPPGMGVILRTAGASRTKADIKRDFEYLSRLWENVRKLTLQSSAPSLVYEEGSLIKRTIRDLYNKDISEVLVSGEAAFEEAREFMQLIMPSHVKNVKLHKEAQHLFSRYGVETQLDAIFSPQVTLPSGGYIVINPTEALVSIDVNSGRATREQNIEATALQTNLEAAEEVARQFRLRDLAGLIVIDFIDMNDRRSIRAVEKKLKDALKNDRARIQIGRISHFGLLEMSRQRMRSGVLESSTHACPTCEGTGIIRGIESRALMVMRAVEDHVVRKPGVAIEVKAPAEVALYMLNAKRAKLIELETQNRTTITINADPTKTASEFSISRGESRLPIAKTSSNSISIDSQQARNTTDEPAPSDATSDNDNQPKRKRRRRKSSSSQSYNDISSKNNDTQNTENADETDGDNANSNDMETVSGEEKSDGQPRKRRRRGRRGGRRNRRGINTDVSLDSSDSGQDNGTSIQNGSDNGISDNDKVAKEPPALSNETDETHETDSASPSEKKPSTNSSAADIEGNKSAKSKKPARRNPRKKPATENKTIPVENDMLREKPAEEFSEKTSGNSDGKNHSGNGDEKPKSARPQKTKLALPEDGSIISTSNTETNAPVQRKGWWSRG